ncbi:MAG: M56 family metallopeptidase [Clostridiales bacterium]|jgi:beta-lactamase regulating signal transducer with metallopeptidase domain|nr:M56 family metallopeptidase [Clostridiales bacterium]
MDKLFLTILNISLSASLIITAIIFVRFPLKKASKAISYALWAGAGFRLISPFTFEGVLNLFQSKSAPVPPVNATQAFPPMDNAITVVNNTVSAVIRTVPITVYNVTVTPMSLWIEISAYIWLIGICAMLIYSVASVFLLSRKLKNSVNVGNNLYEAAGLQTPFVLGLFHPKIYIPTELKENDRRYVILHEQMHIRRFDHFVKYVSYLILCIHWFNPLVWSAFLLMGKDMEMCCDEWVLKEMCGSRQIGDERKAEYSMSLLSMAMGRRIIGGSPLAFGEGDVKERVKNVMVFKKHSRIIIVVSICIILSILLVVTVFFNFNLMLAKTSDNDSTSGLHISDIENAEMQTINNEVVVEQDLNETYRNMPSSSMAMSQVIDTQTGDINFQLENYSTNKGNIFIVRQTTVKAFTSKKVKIP